MSTAKREEGWRRSVALHSPPDVCGFPFPVGRVWLLLSPARQAHCHDSESLAIEALVEGEWAQERTAWRTTEDIKGHPGRGVHSISAATEASPRSHPPLGEIERARGGGRASRLGVAGYAAADWLAAAAATHPKLGPPNRWRQRPSGTIYPVRKNRSTYQAQKVGLALNHAFSNPRAIHARLCARALLSPRRSLLWFRLAYEVCGGVSGRSTVEDNCSGGRRLPAAPRLACKRPWGDWLGDFYCWFLRLASDGDAQDHRGWVRVPRGRKDGGLRQYTPPSL